MICALYDANELSIKNGSILTVFHCSIFVITIPRKTIHGRVILFILSLRALLQQPTTLNAK